MYILYLNKYATRTYCDLSQYPVFPWLIVKREQIDQILGYLETEHKENDKMKDEFRDMRYPISMQTEEKREEMIKKYEDDEVQDEDPEEEEKNKKIKFHSHFNSHFSSPAFVYYYLMRLNPYLKHFIQF